MIHYTLVNTEMCHLIGYFMKIKNIFVIQMDAKAEQTDHPQTYTRLKYKNRWWNIQ